MEKSKELRFPALAKSLREEFQRKCNHSGCEVSCYDSSIIIQGGLGGMIPHTIIVLVYRFALANNLLMYFDTTNVQLVLH